MRTLFRLETSAFSRLDLPLCNHTTATCPCQSTVHVCFHSANDAVVTYFADLQRRPSRQAVAESITNAQFDFPATSTNFCDHVGLQTHVLPGEDETTILA